MNPDDTIVAIASAHSHARRGIVRISGLRALEVAAALLDATALAWPGRPAAIEAKLCMPGGRKLAATLFVWPGSRSFTSQPTVEVHTIGAPPLLELVVAAAVVAGARLAEPGEFTLRAFLAGRIDLTQAEAVLGVIDATSDAALQTSLKQLAGGLATPLAALREELLMLLAELEAGLDFAEEDIEFITAEVLTARLAMLHGQVNELAKQVTARKLDSGLAKVALVGAVNSGKSSLFNAMVDRFGTASHRTRAIESPQRGATRDYLTAEVCLGGVDCLLMDTAGIEEVSAGSVSSMAQVQTESARETADLLLGCIDPSEKSPEVEVDDRTLVVFTKADQSEAPSPLLSGTELLTTSAYTGVGLDQLATAVGIRLTQEDCQLVPSTAQRSAASLRAAETAIAAAIDLAGQGGHEELVATELRLALDELGQVAGVVYTDDVLDRIFSRFCIGK